MITISLDQGPHSRPTIEFRPATERNTPHGVLMLALWETLDLELKGLRLPVTEEETSELPPLDPELPPQDTEVPSKPEGSSESQEETAQIGDVPPAVVPVPVAPTEVAAPGAVETISEPAPEVEPEIAAELPEAEVEPEAELVSAEKEGDAGTVEGV